MKFTPAIGVLLALGQSVVAKPVEARQSDRGHYTVSGLGSRKQAVMNAGGTTQDLGIAMLETEDMTTNYPYGDNKSGDAANFGIFKQNWLMLRTAVGQFQGQSASDWNNGAVLNNDLNLDISARHTCQNYYGYDTWVAGHRNGATGLQNPDTADIESYKSAIEWIRQQIESDSKYLTDDTRFWVDVPPI